MAKGVWFQTGSYENYGSESWNHIYPWFPTCLPWQHLFPLMVYPEMIKAKMVLDAGRERERERERERLQKKKGGGGGGLFCEYIGYNRQLTDR